MLNTEKEYVLSNENYHIICGLVYNHCGISLGEGKYDLVQARLAKMVKDSHYQSIDEYVASVQFNTSSKDLNMLVEAITTNVTSFFREIKHFEFLKKTVIPELIKKKKEANDRKIRIWSAGCSSGEEPYSIAITLLESIENYSSWDIKILATDISMEVLSKSKIGKYHEEKIAPVPPMWRQKYFIMERTPGDCIYQVSNTLKNIIAFKHLNLMNPWPIKIPLDFIFCRNVMIYFDKKTQEMLINKFYNNLMKGGYLFTGHSESLTGIKHKFKYVEPTIYRKPLDT